MSERLRAIVESMNIRPGDRVLEIGCGHGVAATFICEKLKKGRFVAIDRSRKMIGAAVSRNQSYIQAGVAKFLVIDVQDFSPRRMKFDKILAVRVALFHKSAAANGARDRLKQWLKPNGAMFLIYDEPK